MVAALVTKEQLANRIGAGVLDKASDDNNDGVGDPAVIAQLLDDASTYVRGGMPQHDPDDVTPANAVITGELRRLALDAAEMLVAKRRPTVYKRAWKELKESLDEDLERLMKGQRSLGSNTNPTPADHSVSVHSSVPRGTDYWP